MAFTREDVEKIWQEAKHNVATLQGCAGPHDFQPIDPTKKLGGRYRCTRCLGEVDCHAFHWYERGLVHGKAAG